MTPIIFEDPMEGFGEKGRTISKNQRMYGQYFFTLYIELYHVLHDGNNTEKLDNVLATIRKIFPKLDNNRSASLWLEYDIFVCWHHCLRDYEDEIVIEQAYIDEFLNSQQEQNNLWTFLSNYYFRTILNELIYSNEDLLRKYPTFLEGEFALFLRRQPTLKHNNVAYFEIVNLIMHALKDKEDLFALAKKNIIDISKLATLEENFTIDHSLCTFGKWCNHYDFLKKVAENSISLNVHLEFGIIQNKVLFIPEEIKKFLYYSIFNFPEIVIMPKEELVIHSQRLQQERLEELGPDIATRIYDFLIENKDFFHNKAYNDEEYEILNHIMSNKTILIRELK